MRLSIKSSFDGSRALHFTKLFLLNFFLGVKKCAAIVYGVLLWCCDVLLCVLDLTNVRFYPHGGGHKVDDTQCCDSF